MPCLARTREAAASLGKVLTEHLGEDGVQVVPGDWNVQRFDLTDWIARLRGVRVGRSSNTSSCEQAIPLALKVPVSRPDTTPPAILPIVLFSELPMKTVLQNLDGSSPSKRISPLKPTYCHSPIVLLAILAFTAAAFGQSAPRTQVSEVSPANYDCLHVGDSDGRRIVVPTNQVLSPLGRQVIFSARPTAVAIGPQGRWLAVMCHDRVSVIDLDTGVIVGSAPHRGSYTGITWTPNGTKILASNSQGTIDEYSVAPDGKLKRDREIRLLPPGGTAVESVPGVSKGTPPTYKNPLPAGLALVPG